MKISFIVLYLVVCGIVVFSSFGSRVSNFFGDYFLKEVPITVPDGPLPLKAEKISWKLQDNTEPLASGPGIVVSEPVLQSSDSSIGNFGTGCALWLQLHMGGQPEFGKTPLWDKLDRARIELIRSDLQLSSDEAIHLAPILGVTHVLIGTIQGKDPSLTLSYNLIDVPAGKSIGAPIIITGTKERIIAALPQLAKDFSKRLSVESSSIPKSLEINSTDLQFLGQIRWQKMPLSDEQQIYLRQLAEHSSLAGLIYLNHAPDSSTQFNKIVNVLLAQDGSNPLVWGEIAEHRALSLLPHANELSVLTARYPNNYNLTSTEVGRYRVVADREPELKAAERLTIIAPHNPDSWLRYAETVATMAQALRQGRFSGYITDEEWGKLHNLYPQWEISTRHATELDPAYVKGWMRVATAASFNSDSVAADQALQTALAISWNYPAYDRSEIYWWGIEMYQPKWSGDPTKLNQLAYMAAADKTLSSREILTVASQLKGAGYEDLRKKVLNNYLVHERSILVTHPNDGMTHWDLASVYEVMGRKADALEEYDAAVKLMPENAPLRYVYGNAMYAPGSYDKAVEQFREGVRADPDYPDDHFYLGYGLKHLGKFEEAKKELDIALSLEPAHGEALMAQGEILSMQKDKDLLGAIAYYKKALALGFQNIQTYYALTHALDETKQYDELIATCEAGLRIYYKGDATLYNRMADGYLQKKQWEPSIEFSNKAIELNADNENTALAHQNIGEAYLVSPKKPVISNYRQLAVLDFMPEDDSG